MADINLQIITSLVDNASAQLKAISDQLGGTGTSQGLKASLDSVKASAQQVALGFGLMGAAILGPLALFVSAASSQQVAVEHLNNALLAMKEAGQAAVSTDSTLTDQKKRLNDQIAANDSAIEKLTQRYDHGKVSMAAYQAGVDKLNQANETLQTKISGINDKISNSTLNVAEASKAFQNLAIKNTDLGFTVSDSEDAFAALLKITGSVAGATNLMSLSMDVARSYNMPLNDAASALGKIYEGNTRGLLQFGISLKDNLTPMQALDEIQQKVGTSGQSAAGYAATFAGQMAVAQANANLLEIQLGNGLLPVLTTLLRDLDPIIKSVISWTQAHPELTKDIMILTGVAGLLFAGIAALAALITSATIVITAFGAATTLTTLGLTAMLPAITGLLGPLGLAVIAVAALQKAFNDLDAVQNNLITTNNNLADATTKGLAAAKAAFDAGKLSASQYATQVKMIQGNQSSQLATTAASQPNSIMDFLKIPGFATGGIVNGPTLAMVGENGPEAIVPLNGTGGGGSATSGIVVNINNGNFMDQNSARQIGNTIARIINQSLKLRTF